ncbi:unnamed protein product [Dibothriocephalus latus]|uniref:Uncharacterized protein n=1 Tax=Dibothriocephalus latus TaxID=60516 RepID=A0A3P7NR14_DIBLA|nr:unnamed protein product [Dibothriocephalus latus]
MATRLPALTPKAATVQNDDVSAAEKAKAAMALIENEALADIRVVWHAKMNVNPIEDLPSRTTTHGFPPKLAQEYPDLEFLPATFKDPLANLRLDEEIPVWSPPGEHGGAEPRTKQSRRLSRLLGRKTTSRGGKRLGFLKTIPDKSLPVPPLVRSAYFYSYGRCPACAGFYRQPMRAIECSLCEKARSTNRKRAFGHHTSQRISNSTKDGTLEHLIGKTKRKISDGRARDTVRQLGCMLEDVGVVDTLEVNAPSIETRMSFRLIPPSSRSKTEVSTTTISESPNFYKQADDAESFHTMSTQSYGDQLSVTMQTSQFLLRKKERFTPRNQLKPDVMDLKYMYPGSTLLSAKLKDYDCHVPLISYDTNEMRELYTVTILKDTCLRRLLAFRNLSTLPPELHYIKNIKKKEESDDSLPGVKTLDADGDKDQQFRVTMENTAKSILSELANQFYEADYVVLSLFTNWLERARKDTCLLCLQTADEIDAFLHIMGREIVNDIFKPAGNARMQLLFVLATASEDARLRHNLWIGVKVWLEPLLLSLLVESTGTREEACYTLAYLFSSNTLVNDMRHNYELDIPFDVASVVLRALEMRPESFMHFFCLLAYMIEGCPCYSILNCLIDKAPKTKITVFRQRWPLLIYYAFRHWEHSYLFVSPFCPKRISEAMLVAYGDPVSRKAARMALCAISIRTHFIIPVVTCWLNQWTNRDDESSEGKSD